MNAQQHTAARNAAIASFEDAPDGHAQQIFELRSKLDTANTKLALAQEERLSLLAKIDLMSKQLASSPDRDREVHQLATEIALRLVKSFQPQIDLWHAERIASIVEEHLT